MSTVALIQDATSRHRRQYLEALRELDDVTAVAVVDPQGSTVPEARAALSAASGPARAHAERPPAERPPKPVRHYATFADLARAESAAMAIVTLDGVAAPDVIAPVLEAGVPVLAEKPACVSADGFARLAETADRRRAPLMLALCNRLAPWAQDARRVLAGGGIGRLYVARVMTLADQARIWDPRTRDWTFRKATAGGGHLIWLGIHWLDALLYLTGARVLEVQALTANAGGAPIDVEDVATLNLRLAGGALASLVSGYVVSEVAGAQAAKQIDVSLWGSEGWLRFDMGRRALDWHSQGAGESPQRGFRYDSGGGGYTPFVRDCLRASVGEIPPPITAAEGLEVLRVIFAAYAAAETGRTVRLAGA